MAGTDFESLRKAQRRPRESVALCLRGDLFAERERLARQVADLAERAKREESSLAGDPELASVRDRLAVLKEQMAESTVEFVFEALPRADFAEIEDAFPGLKPGEDLPRELRRRVLLGSLVSPVLTDAEFDEFCADLSDGQADLLEHHAWAVNRQTGSVPLSVSGSEATG